MRISTTSLCQTGPAEAAPLGLTCGLRAACGLLQEGGKEFIGNLVDIHKHFVMMFDECCDGDHDLHDVLKQAYARALACSPAPLPSPHYVCVHAKMCGVAAQGG